MRTRFLRSLTTCLSLCIFGQAAYAENTAILIGIGQYPFLPKDGQLRAPVSDVLAMRRFLIEENWFTEAEIRPLLNADATADGILAEIAAAAARSKAGDDVLIYFSGHGARFEDVSGDEDDGLDELLVAYDAGDPNWDEQGLPGVIPDDFMAHALTALDGRNVTVIVDACHSATSTRAGDEDPLGRAVIRATRLSSARGASRNPIETSSEGTFIESRGAMHTVWAAAAPEQYSWEQGDKGIFTNFFIQGLSSRAADANGNGVITSSELLDYTRTRTEQWCNGAEECRSLRQGFTPHYEGPSDQVILSYQTESDVEEPSDPVDPEPIIVVDDEPTTDQETNEASDQVAVSDLLGTKNDAQLELTIPNGTSLKVADTVRFEIQTQRSGTMILFDVDPEGNLLQLSPSAISRENIERVKAGELINIPEGLSRNGLLQEMEVTIPTGRGQLVALLIEDETVDIDTLLAENLTGAPIANARAYLASLAERLRRMQAQGGSNKALKWSTTYLSYEITN